MIPAVELQRIIQRFGDVVAVDNVDLSIADGEFLLCWDQADVEKQQPYV